MKEKLLELVQKIQPYEDIGVESELMESGILDSLDFAELLVAIEEEFHVKIPDDSFNSENFSTVSAIEKMLKSMEQCSDEEY